MDESYQYLKKLDKPLLRRTERIPEDVLHLELGKPVPVADDRALRARLLEVDKQVKSKSAMFGAVGWFIAIAFSLAITAACICTVKPGTGILNSLSALVVMESFVWIPVFLIIQHRKSFRTAVNAQSEIQGYQFPIQKKWIYEYYDETVTQRMYLIQFANVYTDVGYAFDALKCEDFVILYIVSCNGKQYFADWAIKPRR